MDEQNPQVPPTQPADQQPVAPPQEDFPQPEKHGLVKNILGKLKVVVILVGSIIVGAILFYAGYLVSQQLNNPNQNTNVTPTPSIEVTNEPTPTPEEQVVPVRGYRYVAFVKNETSEPNVWIVDNNGTNRRKISNNTDRNTTFPDITWRKFDTVGYAFCPETADACGIKSYSIYYENEITHVDPTDLPKDSRILTIDFDETGKNIAYIYTTADGRSFVQLINDNKQQTLKELPSSLGRGGTFNDDVSVTFSPDGRHLLVINTLTQPNSRQNYETLWVFETATGSEIIRDGKQNELATMGDWLSNDFIMYKRGQNYLRKNIATGGETPQGEFVDRYNPTVSPVADVVTFWSYPVNRKTQIGTYNLESRRFFAHTVDVYKPQWFSRNEVIALGTRETSGEVSFTNTGRLLLVNISSNSLFELEAEDVDLFSVEPLYQ
ncbi:hypothetical protein KC573_01960 [candidate division WWE3 bacterium]|uniref:Uncharacterized protein n=1 Tax=candidate division WWE3 bacterium TaxID=2053526 RepID=A0A955LVL6_UNCKA|nr:hypothetical protein [candidate division WWE3 bacterium]